MHTLSQIQELPNDSEIDNLQNKILTKLLPCSVASSLASLKDKLHLLYQ